MELAAVKMAFILELRSGSENIMLKVAPLIIRLNSDLTCAPLLELDLLLKYRIV